MTRRSLFVLSTTALLCLLNAGVANAQKLTPQEKLIQESDWRLEIDAAGATQEAGIRIRNGALYPASKKLNNIVGEAAFLAPEKLHLTFVNHPKISQGEVILTKAANGLWAGILVQPGMERRIVMKRTRW